MKTIKLFKLLAYNLLFILFVVVLLNIVWVKIININNISTFYKFVDGILITIFLTLIYFIDFIKYYFLLGMVILIFNYLKKVQLNNINNYAKFFILLTFNYILNLETYAIVRIDNDKFIYFTLTLGIAISSIVFYKKYLESKTIN